MKVEIFSDCGKIYKVGFASAKLAKEFLKTSKEGILKFGGTIISENKCGFYAKIDEISANKTFRITN